jgi:proteasome lid subunit RPN8/RPN11
MAILHDRVVRHELVRAWIESNPATTEACEQGGFVVRELNGNYRVVRWPTGKSNCIEVPCHVGGNRDGLPVVATFHTHPNPPPDYLQEPSLTDIRAVRDDPDLCHPDYEGELVISAEAIYRISRSGMVEYVGGFHELLMISAPG